MADKKISALTGATTPLAGTEVLPIVQSGATVKVAVSDLTAGRAISATQLTLSTGNLIIGTSGKGIDFSATPGTGTSELLNDYEEGTFTPTLLFGGASVGITYAVNDGSYTKIGRLVTGRFILVLSSKGSSTGGAAIAGLPFTVGSSIGSAATQFASNFALSPPTAGYPENGAATISIWAMGATGITGTTDTNFNNNTRLDMWFQYFV